LFRGDYEDLDKCPKCGSISTRGKKMVEMITMLMMTRTSPWRSQSRRRRRWLKGLL
jgi:Zn-finger nucleic acid-binding protein